ncbi:DUF5060 domain-containing protein [Synoicihabitans lomoniglobus]|uniref:DUF5060 domain-containing protein n=1 Tax=Synoicihabitans lomoniglobus TaxID=2909285 RepID=A0AAE9ZYA0_9BACT|nr:DUF5060 domain-containing protein [Opitutaceae bacterium LMO-M01]WED65574.1 DUF5060 domain-containing protein [Opitutaceae bacterium LMO-M01]
MKPVRALISFVLLPLLSAALSAQHPAAAVSQWDTVTLSFPGPDLSETAEVNPFADVRLQVTFTHADASYTIPGFYAADGNAAESGADTGNVWQVRFTPDHTGPWTWSAAMHIGPDAVLLPADFPHLKAHHLDHNSGAFEVTPSSATGRDFRAHGRLSVDPATGYFHFASTGRTWIKAGADSPENFLGYRDFDDTYRHSETFREGENRPNASLHTYAPHLADWREGDPTWHGDKGKSIIGALNYLAGTGMNAVYFLTLNIDGDGKDVWPYRTHTDRDRFDCSRLDQWEIVFQHMERLGLAMHVVTQETENERLLDGGFTGRERRLYYRELIARFGHHLGLIWNLGEENGPANFSPHGQTTEQQKAMADYLAATDPYGHPIIIHTHSTSSGKDEVTAPLLGHPTLDGLSFQVDEPTRVHGELLDWRQRARAAGHPWLITMDEIGQWHTGAVPDADDPTHDSLRYQALWGSLMAGASGVEWYFGARYAHNDLSAEDWRSRDNLWRQTRHALDFFTHLPVARMEPADNLTPRSDDYVLAYPGFTYAIYLPDATAEPRLDLGRDGVSYSIHWFNPRAGGNLQSGPLTTVSATGEVTLGAAPADPDQDWVVLVRRR